MICFKQYIEGKWCKNSNANSGFICILTRIDCKVTKSKVSSSTYIAMSAYLVDTP